MKGSIWNASRFRVPVGINSGHHTALALKLTGAMQAFLTFLSFVNHSPDTRVVLSSFSFP